MTKAELIALMATEAQLTQKDAAAALDAFTNVVTEALKSDDAINLVGFGAFKSTMRAERAGRNPKTGEPMTIAAKRVPSFKAGKTLKDAVNC